MILAVTWPSEVVDNEVPSLTDIMASGGDACLHASKLLTESHALASKGDQLSFQEIFFVHNDIRTKSIFIASFL